MDLTLSLQAEIPFLPTIHQLMIIPKISKDKVTSRTLIEEGICHNKEIL
jgi:hypothetical protein